MLVSTFAILTTAYILDGVYIVSVPATIALAGVLAILNTFLKPILIILTLPFTLITLGLFLLVINAIIVLIADYLMDGFTVVSFFDAVLFSICLSVITSIFNFFVLKENETE